MRTMYVILILVWVGFAGYSLYAVREYEREQTREFVSERLRDRSSGSRGTFTWDARYEDVGRTFAAVSMVVIALAAAGHVVGMVKVRTKANKVLTILALVFAAGMWVWSALVYDAPGHMGLDEVVPAWLAYQLVMVAFATVGAVQAKRAGTSRGIEVAVPA